MKFLATILRKVPYFLVLLYNMSCYPLTSQRTSRKCDQIQMSQKDCEAERAYAYRMSFNATTPCDPMRAPLGEICKGSHLPPSAIDGDSQLRPIMTKYKYDWQPSTLLMGTAPYKARGEGHFDPRNVDVESYLMTPDPRPCCNKLVSDMPTTRWEMLPQGTVTAPLEQFQPGGVPTRCSSYIFPGRRN